MQHPRTEPRTLTLTPAGILGTLALAAVIAGCVRLGVWQLDRLDQRRTLNAAVAERMHGPPLEDIAALLDTAGAIYRIADARGTFDNERSIVLPGRSYRGTPGVHLLSPLRIQGGGAILVNRGWVPSADAASIEIDAFAHHDTVELRGIVLPFPARHQSLAQRGAAATRDSAFRRVWFSVDERALRAQFPYPMLPAMLQALPSPDAPRWPTRLEPPVLDEGPHLSYALQWFSFAGIGVIGWLALVFRGRSARRRTPVAAVLAVLALSAWPRPLQAQLRPVDPLDWRVYEPGTLAVASVGAGALWGQTAALAGTRGRLLEIGNYTAVLRFGRVAVELAGTALWRLSDEVVLESPVDGVRPPDGAPRQEAGFASAATVVNLTRDESPLDVVVRFGTRIPTTSDESGLDRDRTDFFALAGARYRFGLLALSAENGVGIHGTTRHDYPQSDVWAYAFGAEYRRGPLTGMAQLVGHQDGHGGRVRGNEDLRELRLGLRAGSARWIEFTWIRGLSDFSPAHGLRIAASLRLGADQPGKLGR